MLGKSAYVCVWKNECIGWDIGLLNQNINPISWIDTTTTKNKNKKKPTHDTISFLVTLYVILLITVPLCSPAIATVEFSVLQKYYDLSSVVIRGAEMQKTEFQTLKYILRLIFNKSQDITRLFNDLRPTWLLWNIKWSFAK